jgi:hypothetical protein
LQHFSNKRDSSLFISKEAPQMVKVQGVGRRLGYLVLTSQGLGALGNGNALLV